MISLTCLILANHSDTLSPKTSI